MSITNSSTLFFIIFGKYFSLIVLFELFARLVAIHLLNKKHSHPNQQAECQGSQSRRAQGRVEGAACLGHHAPAGFNRQREREPGQQGRPGDPSLPGGQRNKQISNRHAKQVFDLRAAFAQGNRQGSFMAFPVVFQIAADC